MAKQSLLWTALPNGYTDDGKSLHVSLLLSARLDPESDPAQLASFPDFIDWPETLSQARFNFTFGAPPSITISGSQFAGKNRIDDRVSTADSRTWKALFSDKTPVQGYTFRDLSKHAILSYPASNMDSLVRNLYTRVATAADDQLPKVSAVLGDNSWQRLIDVVARMDSNDQFVDYQHGVRNPRAQFAAFAKGAFNQVQGLARDVALFQLFHTPSSAPILDRYPSPRDDAQARARWLGYKRTALPKPDDFQKQIDFHQIVAAMNQFPILLRRLGLVVDFLIAGDAFGSSPDAPLWADVQLPGGSPTVMRNPDVSPRSRVLLDSKHFQANTRSTPGQSDLKIVNGLLNLDPKLFNLLQTDVDGSGLKILNFARSLSRLRNSPNTQTDPISQQERTAGTPALRNVGWLLVHNGRSQMLQDTFDRQKGFNDAAESIQTGGSSKPPALSVEDLIRGFRIDIWDDVSKEWHSLCRRDSKYELENGSFVIKEQDEEGIVRLAATTSADQSSNPEIVWLHETLVAWTGWSLCVPPPGKTIGHSDADHSDPVTNAEPEIPPGLPLRTSFKVLKGSLPRLRYGRRYWIRARIVDLAGNSLQPQSTDIDSESPKTNAVAYLRYEPISPPAIALFRPALGGVQTPSEGESMECVAIRSFNDTPADNVVPTTQKARRFAVPARTTVKEAEHHGMLDRAGAVDPAFFAMLTTRDNSLPEEKILTAGPLTDAAPVETGYAVMQEGEVLPYLPDPLAISVAARIFNLPGFPPDQIIEIPFFAATKWPDAVSFTIELLEDPTGKPQYDPNQNVLRIPIPKAEHVTLRLSVKLTKYTLRLMGVWNWLTPAQQAILEKRALSGQHWMLTPWREIDLVHAVQRPLIAPDILKYYVDRPFRATAALPNFTAKCSIKSTNHLDVLAQWNEPVEDVTQSASGQNRPRTDHAFSVKITDHQSYAGIPEYMLEAPDLIRAGGQFHDRIPRKVHEFNDTRYRRIEYWIDATTKFREFMPASVLTETVNGKSVATDKNIKITGGKVRTWIRSSAPPPAPEVLYVVPTFGWVRSADQTNKTSWRRGGGLRVYLDRPWNVSGYGEMLAVVLPTASFAGDPSTDPASQPLKNFVTQWGNDPIWLSPSVSGAFPKRANFPLARTAPDPSGQWLPSFAPPSEADQPPGSFQTTGVSVPDLRQSTVEVAPHDVFFDEGRQLWYCDIEVTWGAAYYPFIRLALARYQPVSRSDALLSGVVLSDFMPLVPDRWLNVTQTVEPRTLRVTVFGPTYTDSSAHQEAAHSLAKSVKLPDGTFINVQAPTVAASSVVEVWVERFDPAWGEDFGWLREPDAIVQQGIQVPSFVTSAKSSKQIMKAQRVRARQFTQEREFTSLVNEGLLGQIFVTTPLWDGSATLPEKPAENARYRLVIAEYEEYLVDGERPYDPTPTKKDRRLVFIEYVELD